MCSRPNPWGRHDSHQLSCCRTGVGTSHIPLGLHHLNTKLACIFLAFWTYTFLLLLNIFFKLLLFLSFMWYTVSVFFLLLNYFTELVFGSWLLGAAEWLQHGFCTGGSIQIWSTSVTETIKCKHEIYLYLLVCICLFLLPFLRYAQDESVKKELWFKRQSRVSGKEWAGAVCVDELGGW